MSDRDEKDWIKRNEPWRLENMIGIKDPWYLKLTKIKGIGLETAKDIGLMFNNIHALKIALSEDKVALRNDVVQKLKKELIERRLK